MSAAGVGEERGAGVGDPVEEWLIHELSAGRAVCFRALGGSMWPLVRAGERVTLEPLAFAKGAQPERAPTRALRRGEVYVFLDAGAAEGARLSPLHRLVWARGGRAWCKGDALPLLDAPRPAGAALGRLAGVEGAGRLRAALAAPGGLLGRLVGWALCVGQGAGRRIFIGARHLLSTYKT